MPGQFFAQLGTTYFDGAKSFVSFSGDEGVVVAEHALIDRKPKLQGVGVELRNVTISLFLHQEFCVVAEELQKLRTSRDAFEVLPLLWGNGKLEGNFIIITLNTTNQQMDSLGNLVAVSVSVTLKESTETDNQQQARDSAFATGDKRPPTKSNRKNVKPCGSQISDIVFVIKTNGDRVDAYSRSYTNDSAVNNKMFSHLNIIINNSQKIEDATNDSKSCVFNNIALRNTASDVKTKALAMSSAVYDNISHWNILHDPDIAGMKAKNDSLQAAIKSLQTASNKITKSAIAKK